MAITDLTNTTWNIPSGWSATSGYGKFGVDCTVNDVTPASNYLPIGYGTGDMGAPVATANTIAFWNAQGGLSSFVSSDALTIVITGGTDATNTNLISWLEANGELQKPDPTLTYDLTQLNLSAGTHTISVIGKADGYKASAASAGASYTVELPQLDPAVISLDGDTLSITDESGLASTATIYVDGEVKETVEMVSLISFTIGSTSYQAEDGMTWAEWVESDYNTGYLGDDIVANGTVIGLYGTLYVLQLNGVGVKQTNTIVVSATYSFVMHSGDA